MKFSDETTDYSHIKTTSMEEAAGPTWNTRKNNFGV